MAEAHARLSMGLQREAHSIVDGILPELQCTVEYDARDSVRWAETQDVWDAVRGLLSQMQVPTAILQFQEGIQSGLITWLDPEDSLLLATKGNLALAVKAQGDLGRARRLEEEILAARERLLPPDHPDLFISKWNLAVTVKEQGDLGRARKLEEEVLAAWNRLLPPDHPDLFSVKGNLAVTVKAQGDLELARELEEEVLTARTRLLPPDHPDLLSAKGNLAGTVFSQGDLGRARALQEEVLAAQMRLLPPDHRNLLSAKGNLAVTVKAQGDLGRARQLQEEVLAAQRRLLPPNHPDLFSVKGNLALTVRAQGDLGRARELEEEVLAAQMRFLPPDHPDLLSIKGNLAQTARAQGDLGQARELEEEVLATRMLLLRPDHPDLLSAKGNLAVTVSSQGDLGRARKMQEQVLAAHKRLLPPDHPGILLAKANLAFTLKKQGNQSEADELAKSLFASSLSLTLRAQTSAPRETGAILQQEVMRLARLRFLSATDQTVSALFQGIETLRAIAVPSAQRRHFLRQNPKFQDLQQQLRNIGGTLNALSTGPVGAEDMQTWQDRFQEATHRRDTLEKELSHALEEAGIRIDPIGHDIVSARLDNAVLVSYFRYNHWELDQENRTIDNGPSLLAHMLKPDGTLHQVELGTIRSLTEVIAAWRSTLDPLETKPDGSLTREQLEHRAQEPGFAALVRERLLDPIIETLGGWDSLTSFERLIVIPDDIVHFIPFDALTIPNEKVKNRRLFEVIPVQVEMSLRLLLDMELPLAEGTGLISVGGIHYDSRGSKERATDEKAFLSYLPGTKMEMEAISKAFAQHREGKPDALTEAAATAETVKTAVQGKRIVHLATHGWFGLIPADAFGSRSMTEPAPDQTHARLAQEFAPLSLCGLAFAGAGVATNKEDAYGRVTGEELATWELEACELILLTACQTNVGRIRPGQGIQSLQAAVHAAGARTALTSLWHVPDGPTERLTAAFCEMAFNPEEGVSTLEALHRAKRTLRDQGLPASAWAGWVLTGNPGLLEVRKQ